MAGRVPWIRICLPVLPTFHSSAMKLSWNWLFSFFWYLAWGFFGGVVRGKARFFKKIIFSLGKNYQKWQKSSYAKPQPRSENNFKNSLSFYSKKLSWGRVWYKLHNWENSCSWVIGGKYLNQSECRILSSNIYSGGINFVQMETVCTF